METLNLVISILASVIAIASTLRGYSNGKKIQTIKADINQNNSIGDNVGGDKIININNQIEDLDGRLSQLESRMKQYSDNTARRMSSF